MRIHVSDLRSRFSHPFGMHDMRNVISNQQSRETAWVSAQNDTNCEGMET